MSSAKWEEEWLERLQFLGPGRAMIIGWPGSRSIRIEAFCEEKLGRKLVQKFGGRLTQARDWVSQPKLERPPLRIRGKLIIHENQKSFAAHKGSGLALFIPAGMAFGTGEHATTASCLRMMCDLKNQLPVNWRAIDVGAGSGILAIAAAKLGAQEVVSIDFDPTSVRITRANARANSIRNLRADKADILSWKPPFSAEVVTANLFSDLLIKAAPILKRAIKKNGWLIFSGVLRMQLDEVVTTFEKLGFEIERRVIRGKWSAGLCRRL